MKISRVVIKNYRNIENIDIHLSDTVALIGENNSGKSNFLRAITLPFFTDETSLSGKNLAWTDINNNAKEKYYRYVVDNQEKIKNDIISCEDFISNMPVITVDVYLEPNETENFFVKELCWNIVNGEMVYGLRYEYKPAKIDEIFATVKNVLNKENMEVSKIGCVTYIEDCFRCPIKHLKLSNLLVEDSQKQHSSKEHGVVTVWFESEKTCADLLKEYEFDLSYISKKQGMYDTHIKENNTDITLSLSEEIAPILRRNHTSLEDIILKKTAYYFAGKIITSYRENRDRVLAIKQFTNYEKISRKDYGILINAIPENRIEEVRDTIVVSSIDSIKGKEGKNCLFILTTDLAAYLFAKKTSDNATKNRLYVALTRSLESLTIFITVEVEIQYGKTNILDFFAKNLTMQ